jgi:hypothetical protein
MFEDVVVAAAVVVVVVVEDLSFGYLVESIAIVVAAVDTQTFQRNR